MNYESILVRTAIIGLFLVVPAAIAAGLMIDRAAAYGVLAGFVIAVANLFASLYLLLRVSADHPNRSLAVMLFGFLVRLSMIGLVLYLLSTIRQINISTAGITLVVVYSVFAFSEFRFSSLPNESQSRIKTKQRCVWRNY